MTLDNHGMRVINEDGKRIGNHNRVMLSIDINAWYNKSMSPYEPLRGVLMKSEIKDWRSGDERGIKIISRDIEGSLLATQRRLSILVWAILTKNMVKTTVKCAVGNGVRKIYTWNGTLSRLVLRIMHVFSGPFETDIYPD